MRTWKSNLFPFLFAVYPILTIYNYNAIYLNFSSIFRILAFTILVTLLGLVVVNKLINDQGKAALISSLFIILFFSYGHVYLSLKNMLTTLPQHKVLLAVWGGMFVIGLWAITRRLEGTHKMNQLLTVISTILITISIIQITRYEYSVYKANLELLEKTGEIGEQAEGMNDQVLPDIYWIILDAHTRSDILFEDYGVDNSTFTDELTNLGFYVSKCSLSNYPSTNYSLYSTLTMQYLQENFEQVRVLPPWESSIVIRTLDSFEYTSITFETPVHDRFKISEDIFITRNPLILEKVSLFRGINAFESMVFETSLLRLLEDGKYLLPEIIRGDFKTAEMYDHYVQVLFVLDELEKIPDIEIEGPKFVVGHLLVPHTPFVFSPKGDFNPNWRLESNEGYIDNVNFIDSRIPDVINNIIEKSESPPIIILQGDHGNKADRESEPEALMSILNAYYFPQGNYEALYDTITPVNTFRIVFNNFFGGDYELLDDISYFARGKKELSEDRIVPNTCELQP